MKDLSGLADFLERKWFDRSGLAASVVASSIGSVTLLTSQSDAAWIRALVALITAGAVFGVWLLSRRVPKAKRGRVGIVVTISSENDEESQRLRADFIEPLRKAIHNGVSGGSIHLIELPRFLTGKIVDKESADAIRRKCRAHMVLYGRVRRRANGVDEFCHMELDGVVSHRPVPLETSLAFGNEFSELLPRGITIPAGQEFAGFTFTSGVTEIVSKYILGVAAGLSGDLQYAESMFSEVQARVKTSTDKFPIFAKLAQRIPFRLSEIYEAKANIAYSQWRAEPTPERVAELGNAVAAIGSLSIQRRESYYFFSAIHHFLYKRDIASALASLSNVKNTGGIWNLNVAFLNAYKGNLKSAARNYKSSAAKEVDIDTILQVEDFLCRILEIEPQKVQLHYCLGLFNAHVKGDKARAIQDFNFSWRTEPQQSSCRSGNCPKSGLKN